MKNPITIGGGGLAGLSLGIGLAVLGAFFHYITRGPKDDHADSKEGGKV